MEILEKKLKRRRELEIQKIPIIFYWGKKKTCGNQKTQYMQKQVADKP